MEIVQIVGIGLVSTVILLILRRQKPEIAVLAGTAAGAVIFMIIAAKLSAVADLLEEYAARADISPMYFTAVAYIAEFGAEICRDAGEGAIAAKIEMAGKVIIIALAVPIITSLLDLVLKIMP